jgi:guanylate kinase
MTEPAGHLFILSAPSGAGKSTLCRAILERFPQMRYSISYTTRDPRGRERNGVEYHFISEEEFKDGIRRNCWAEWAEVHGHYYGTSADFLQESVAGGFDVLLDIDVEGTRQLLQRFPEAVTIFIMPPSLQELRRRLEGRGSDSAEVIRRRMAAAEREMERRHFYRHVVVNDDLPSAEAELFALIREYQRQTPPAGTGSTGS